MNKKALVYAKGRGQIQGQGQTEVEANLEVKAWTAHLDKQTHACAQHEGQGQSQGHG